MIPRASTARVLRSATVATPKDIVTAEDVLALPIGGELVASPAAIVTAWARELAETRGVRITLGLPRGDAPLVALGADHGGYLLKEQIKILLGRLGRRVLDLGTHSTDPVDYPDVAAAVAHAVRDGRAGFGIVVDGAGIGSCMAANKIPGIRAALCVDAAAARNAREHNDANVLTLGAKSASPAALHDIVSTFLSAECVEERHRRRVRKIEALESPTERR